MTTNNESQSQPGNTVHERVYGFEPAFQDLPGKYMDRADGSESAKARVERLLKELSARHNNLGSLADIQRARVEALTLHETWWTFCRTSHGLGKKAISMVELAQSDAWAEVHDQLAGVSWYERSAPYRAETAAWRERMRAELDESRAKEYIREAKAASDDSRYASHTAQAAATKAANQAERADIRANDSERYAERAAQHCANAAAASAEARVHAQYAERMGREAAEQVIAENLAAQGKALRIMLEQILKDSGIKIKPARPEPVKVEVKQSEGPAAKAS